MSTQELTFGATMLAPERTRFRLWAPAQRAPAVLIEGSDAHLAQAVGGGWFETVAPVGAGAAYRWRLDDGALVPDPAARAQRDDVHGPSIVIDPRAYRWRTPGWMGRPWEETVIYEAHAGLMGGFDGVRARLPALAALGVTAIELMPVNAFPGARNWGYDGVLPYAPAGAYGDPLALKRLVDAAHTRGVMIFLDVVYNHFGPDGNYLASYAPDFFRADLATPWGAAIDFRRPEVRRFFTENALYWLTEYRFDGLRFDAVHAIPERDWLDETATAIRAATEPERHVHLMLENERNDPTLLEAGYDAQWNDDIHHVLHVLLTGEKSGYYAAYADKPAEHLARALHEGFVFQGEVFPFGAHKRRGAPSAHLPPAAFIAFLQNHDQIGNRALGDRLTTLAHPDALRAAAALMLFCPHIPMLFMGEETGSTAPFLFFTDHNPVLAQAVREGRRREFAAFPEFSDPASRAAIPDPNAESTYARSRPALAGDPESADVQAFYARLLALRHAHIVPRLKGARAEHAAAIGDAAVVSRWRLGDGARLTLATNLGAAPAAADMPASTPFYATHSDAAAGGRLAPRSTIAWLEAEP